MQNLVLFLIAVDAGNVIRLLLLLGWDFLLRMQSEAFPLQMGLAAECLQLPPGRHSAVFVDASANLCIRWRRRKHRPEGSLLKRPCNCARRSKGLWGKAFCATHTFLEFHDQLQWQTGQGLTQHSALAKTRQMLALVGTENASAMTWKALRAGRASAMAAGGCSLGEILAAGEWRSAAYLRYVSEEVADAGQVLRFTLQSELDEEDEVIWVC